MRTFAAAVLAAVASAKHINSADFDFVQYISKHGKSYKSLEEYSLRYERFRAFDEKIKEFTASEKSSTHGHSNLSDYTHEEMSRMLGLINMSKPQYDQAPIASNLTVPDSFDWRAQGVVNPIKDQAQCGSCWAFAAIAVMESAHALATGNLISLSEQQLVSCASAQGNMGCYGGWYYWAWEYTKNAPVELGSDYPYTSAQGVTGSCLYNSSKGVVKSTGYNQVATDTNSIKAAIVQQPIAVAIEADTAYFQSYTSGILTNASACGTNIDHAVTAVGYGVDPTYGGYYIVRNSWNTWWGDQGYVLIGQADYPGICAINTNIWTTSTN